MATMYRTKAQALAQVKKNKQYSKGRHGGIVNTNPTGTPQWATRLWQGAANFSSWAGTYQASGQAVTDFTNGTTPIVYGTSQICTEAMCDFTHIKLIVANMSTTNPRTIVGAKIVMLADPFNGAGATPTADTTHDADFMGAGALSFTFNGGSAGIVVPALPVTTPAQATPNFRLSDALAVNTIPRTDGLSGLPCFAIRECSSYTDPTDTSAVPFRNISGQSALWRTDPGFLYGQTQPGNKLNSALGKVPAASSQPHTILGFQVLAKGKVMSTIWFGSSLIASQFAGTYNGSLTGAANDKQSGGWSQKGACRTSTTTRPIEHANFGIPGQVLGYAVDAAARCLPVFGTGVSHVVIEVTNVNNLEQPLSDATITLLRTNRDAIIATAKAANPNVKIVGFNGWARNSSTSPYTAAYRDAASDAKRLAYIAECAAMMDYMIDTNTAMSRVSESPQRSKMTALGDTYNAIYFDGSSAVHQSLGGDLNYLTPTAQAAYTALANSYFV